MHRRYAFFNENAFCSNRLCGSWDITFAVHFGHPYVAL